MSGVEGDSSVEDGGNTARDDGVNEADDPLIQASTATAGRSRSQG